MDQTNREFPHDRGSTASSPRDMILALLIAVRQPATPPGDDDIVVLAQCIAKVRWTYEAEDGRLVECIIKRSGGLVVDAIVCEPSRQCAAENPKLGDRHLSPCIMARVRQMLAERRAAMPTPPATGG